MIPADIDNFLLVTICSFSSMFTGIDILVINSSVINYIPREISNIDTLSDLCICRANITNISGLSNCKSLTNLILVLDEIVDISPLSKCISLRNLSIPRNKIDDISALPRRNIFNKYISRIKKYII